MARGPCLSSAHRPRDVRSDSYRFVGWWNGFRIEHPRRQMVELRLVPNGFEVAAGNIVARVDFGLSLVKLSHLVAGLLLGVPDPGAEPPASDEVLREAWAIASRLQAMRAEILARIDPASRYVEEALRPVIGRVPPLAESDAFFRNPHLVRDVVRYRAAAVALAFHESLIRRARRVDPRLWESDEDLVHALGEWRGLFSPDGRAYRSLNRTLMNLPEAVPPRLVCHLSRVRLERPILNATELTTLLLCVSRLGPGVAIPPDRLRIFLHATEEQIRCAVERIGRQTGRRLDPTREGDLDFAVRFLMEAPGPAGGGLDGLVGRALRWHRGPRPWSLANQAATTAMPPIPLPANEGVTFLASVEDVVREGARMHHCIASYARLAVRGKCFLFHVEHDGETASIAVDRQGRIIEAAGPRNTCNAAVFWGVQTLRSWAVDFYRRRPKRRRRRRHDPNQLCFPFLAA